MAEKEGEHTRVKIKGYSGNSVSLEDYGVEHPVVYNIAGINTKDNIPYLLDHSRRDVLGHTENVKKTENAIDADAVHSYPSDLSNEIATAIGNKVPYQASMGLELDGSSVAFVPEGATTIVNGRTFNGPIYVVNKSNLEELSATLFGRDRDTSVTNSEVKDKFMFVKNSTKTGNEPDNTPAPAADPPVTPPTITQNSPPEDTAPQVPTVPTTVDNTWLLDYLEYPELIKNARKDGWDKDRMDREVEIHNTEKNYPGVPDVYLPNRKVDNALEARLALGVGMSEETVGKKFGEKAAEHALSQPQIGLKELLMYVANAEGGRFNGHSDVNNMCRFIKQRVFNMAFSTIDFPNLMNRIADYRMEEAWLMNEPFAPTVCKTVSNKDFKSTGHIRPQGGKMWDGLDKEGKLTHGVAGTEVTYTTKLATVGQILTFKREDIENDDIGWIEEILNLMLEGARMVPDWQLVQKIYGGKGSFTSTGRGNQFDLPLTFTNLETVYNAVRRRQVPKDREVQPMARVNTRWWLVVGEELEKTAWELIKQQKFVSNTTANTLQTEENYWKDKFDIKVFEQLDNETYHADVDPLAWGLWPQKEMYSPYAISFFKGQKRPTTEVVDLPADMLGFGVRGWFDVNVDEREYEMIAWSFPGDASSS